MLSLRDARDEINLVFHPRKIQAGKEDLVISHEFLFKGKRFHTCVMRTADT